MRKATTFCFEFFAGVRTHVGAPRLSGGLSMLLKVACGTATYRLFHTLDDQWATTVFAALVITGWNNQQTESHRGSCGLAFSGDTS